MAPRGVTIHTAKVRLSEVTPKALLLMAMDTERAAGLLADAWVDIIVYGCTTGSLVGGEPREKDRGGDGDIRSLYEQRRGGGPETSRSKSYRGSNAILGGAQWI